MQVQKLREFLDSNGIKYVTITHSAAYTTQEIAARAHIPGKIMAKSVIVKIDGRLAMAVIPGSFKVDFEMLKAAANANNVRLAYEQEFMDKFPDCEVGAMPPFGNLYGLDVYVASSLTQEEEIAFNACSHSELIRMSYKDYEKIVKPKIMEFAYQSFL